MSQETARTKVCYVSATDLLQVFLWEGTGFPVATGEGAVTVLKRLRLDGVPPGTTVRHAFHCPLRNAFGLVVEHPSFDPVPQGEVPPTAPARVTVFYTGPDGREVAPPAASWRDHPSLL